MYPNSHLQPAEHRPPASRIAMFPKRPDQQGKHVLTFVINLTPETVMQLYQAAQATGFAVNQYGQLSGVSLGGAIYQNEKSLGGMVNINQPQQQQQQYQQPPTLPVPVAPVYQQQQQYASAPVAPPQQYQQQQFQQLAPQQQYQQPLAAQPQPAQPANPNYRGL